jgi:hypothetical protein
VRGEREEEGPSQRSFIFIRSHDDSPLRKEETKKKKLFEEKAKPPALDFTYRSLVRIEGGGGKSPWPREVEGWVGMGKEA